MGCPGYSRHVGKALGLGEAAVDAEGKFEGVVVPWWRILNSKGTISLHGDALKRQRRLLEAEGMEFSKSGAVKNFDRIRMVPPAPA
mmetsp:Transcript_49897/g.131575  ORF Transcript_49897/g.131575 Transcript_49897/m.131575 type:complete len:86 (-) Transcript_49897:50-307(-)